RDAFNTVEDFVNNLNGAYSTMGSSNLLGRDLLCFGDLCADACQHNTASFNFQKLAVWSVNDTDDDILAVWKCSYEVVDRTARIIANAETFSGVTTPAFNVCLAQAHALRAWCTFYLANLYGLPYTYDSNSLGVVNVKSPVSTTDKVSRATVAENYAFILEDIAAAHRYYAIEGTTDPGVYYFNRAAVYALEARVKLFMGNYAEARTAAQTAIQRFGGSLVNTPEQYTAMWNTSAMSSEDIMRYQRSATQTHSYYFMWGPSGGAEFVHNVLIEIPESDIRYPIYNQTQYGKFCGTELGNATLSIPLFRLAELYLTIAECQAAEGNYAEAAATLAIVSDARRSALSGHIVADASILRQIQEERKWETLQEGHRFFDARRWKLKIDVYGGVYHEFDIAKFCYPVPADEVNSGYGVTQTDNWAAALPAVI
ncbi:MAG: RagB/SusD family nutrient uptake outer membrane protein, partial [Tannerellaceae bacterium]|nr:RagB/SusD family nutrient uptake outer membrane protein [Tannerellaceae bacterium]